MSPRLLFLALLFSLFAETAEAAAPPVHKKKIVLIAGKKSHGPEGNGIHDYGWSAKLLRVMLERSNIRDQVRVEHHLDGWPRDPRTLEDADAIMVLSDGRDGNLYEEAPFLASPERVRFMDRQMKRGCGFLTFHFSTFTPQKYAAEVLRWNGGYFQWEQDGKRQWYSAIRTLSAEVAIASPKHPISRGLKDFQLNDEFYFNLRFAKDDPALVPIWAVSALPGRKPDGNVVAWARQREDGGRGFGTTCGHFYRNWENASFRKMILNAVAWSAKVDVPTDGVEAKFFTHAEIRAALGEKAALADAPIRVLLVAGNEAHKWHNWPKTSPVIRAALERDPRIRVEIELDFEELGRRKLSDYQAILLNSYCNWLDPKPPSERSREAFAKYLREGGGLVLVHFANGAFHPSLPKAGASDWPEYRKIVRRVWNHTPPRGKPTSSHDAFGRFMVVPTKLAHPITEGLSRFEVFDELYFHQDGDEPIDALLSAESKVTRKLEPLAWTYSYGKGRVFQTLLGHAEKTYDAFEAREMLRRAVAWSADRPIRTLTAKQDPAPLRLHAGPREKLHVYALLGQSNMSGRAPIEKADEASLPGVYLFDDFAQFESATHPLNRFTNVPSGMDRTSNRLNLGWSFAAKMRQANPETSIGLVVNAQGGSAIRTWQKGQPNYVRTLARLRSAGQLKGVLWHQGEEDIHTADGYLEALAKIIADLRADIGDPKLPFVVGQLSPLTSGKDADATRRFNERLLGLPKTIAHVAVVETKGLTGGLHFDSRSTRLLGERYAEAMHAARKEK